MKPKYKYNKGLHSCHQRYHAKCRFEERFGIELNKKLRRKLVDMILSKELIILEKNKIEIKCYYRHNDKEIVLVYDKKNKNIVTCLYYEAYLDNRYIKVAKGVSQKIRKDIEKIIGRDFTPDENREVVQLITSHISRIRDIVKLEAGIIKELPILHPQPTTFIKHKEEECIINEVNK
jgi:hypothetical protein